MHHFLLFENWTQKILGQKNSFWPKFSHCCKSSPNQNPTPFRNPIPISHPKKPKMPLRSASSMKLQRQSNVSGGSSRKFSLVRKFSDSEALQRRAGKKLVVPKVMQKTVSLFCKKKIQNLKNFSLSQNL